MDVLENTDDTSRRHALKRGLSHEMLSALAIFPAPSDEGFDAYVERLNELDCRLCVLNIHSCRQPHYTPTTAAAATPAATTATGITAGPIDLSAARGKLSAAERNHRCAHGLCMYCRGVGHFAAQAQLGVPVHQVPVRLGTPQAEQATAHLPVQAWF